MGADASSLYMWNPVGRSYSFLPKWNPNLPFKTCILLPDVEYPRCFNVMVITGISCPAFAFFRWGKKNADMEWAVQNCTMKEPYSPSQSMEFTNAIGYNGNFYALSMQGSLAVIEDNGTCFAITAIGGGNRVVPSGLSRQFREYLVELDGDLLLVFLVSRKLINLVEDVEVYRLDVETLLWVRMGTIGEGALFLEDECCMGVRARTIGCKKNCIYFTHLRANKWFDFDMESEHISPASGTKESVKREEPINDEIVCLKG